MYPLSFFMLLFGVMSAAATDMVCLGMPTAESRQAASQATEGA